MKEYNYKNLRNVGLIGHGATGKTSLAESLLFYTNNIDRLGKVEDGTTVMDYEQEEKKRKILEKEEYMCFLLIIIPEFRFMSKLKSKLLCW